MDKIVACASEEDWTCIVFRVVVHTNFEFDFLVLENAFTYL